ncbi:MAG: hypothetical protein JXL97_19920 [Bacteroidales bacterium]|nr:hypothetical protein [Bacteroidales bacterium]
MELINQTTAVLSQGAELMKNPAISGAVSGIFGWLKGVLGKKSATEKLELIEQNKHNEETIAGLKANLEFILEDNEVLQKQLSEKLKEIELLMKKEGVDNSVKTNTINVNNSTNTKIAQGIDKIDGNLTIN